MLRLEAALRGVRPARAACSARPRASNTSYPPESEREPESRDEDEGEKWGGR